MFPDHNSATPVGRGTPIRNLFRLLARYGANDSLVNQFWFIELSRES